MQKSEEAAVHFRFGKAVLDRHSRDSGPLQNSFHWRIGLGQGEYGATHLDVLEKLCWNGEGRAGPQQIVIRHQEIVALSHNLQGLIARRVPVFVLQTAGSGNPIEKRLVLRGKEPIAIIADESKAEPGGIQLARFNKTPNGAENRRWIPSAIEAAYMRQYSIRSYRKRQRADRLIGIEAVPENVNLVSMTRVPFTPLIGNRITDGRQRVGFGENLVFNPILENSGQFRVWGETIAGKGIAKIGDPRQATALLKSQRH